jgi:DNA modification methylase
MPELDGPPDEWEDSSKSQVWLGNCRDVMPRFQPGTFDAVITDPPYPCVQRDYGYWTTKEWSRMMDGTMEGIRRLLKPNGSAVIILQPNSEKVGSLRTWLWEFLCKWSKRWNMIQDFYWWNHTAMPRSECRPKFGLCRTSVKICAWFGSHRCYRNQDKVLWEASERVMAYDLEDRARVWSPSGHCRIGGDIKEGVMDRGGSTPFNLLPISNTEAWSSSSSVGHGAGTPYALCDWWVRYLVPRGGLVLDPFFGAGTVGQAVTDNRSRIVGIERMRKYARLAASRLKIPLYT